VITASTTAYSAIVWPDSSRIRSSIEVIILNSTQWGHAVEHGAHRHPIGTHFQAHN
jgi:hypothetical protein